MSNVEKHKAGKKKRQRLVHRGIELDTAAARILAPDEVAVYGRGVAISTLCGIYGQDRGQDEEDLRPIKRFGSDTILTYIMQAEAPAKIIDTNTSRDDVSRRGEFHRVIMDANKESSGVGALLWASPIPEPAEEQVRGLDHDDICLSRSRGNIVKFTSLDPYDLRTVRERLMYGVGTCGALTTQQVYTFILHGPIYVPGKERLWSAPHVRGMFTNHQDLTIGEAQLTVSIGIPKDKQRHAVEIISCVAFSPSGARIENIDHFEVIRLVYASLDPLAVRRAALDASIMSYNILNERWQRPKPHELAKWLLMSKDAVWAGLIQNQTMNTQQKGVDPRFISKLICDCAVAICMQVVFEDQRWQLEHNTSPAAMLTPSALVESRHDSLSRTHTALLRTMLGAYTFHAWSSRKLGLFLRPYGGTSSANFAHDAVWSALIKQAEIDAYRDGELDDDLIAEVQSKWLLNIRSGDQEGEGEVDQELWATVRSLTHDICQAPIVFGTKASGVAERPTLDLEQMASITRAAHSFLTLISLPLCATQRQYAASQVYRVMFAAERAMQPCMFDTIATLCSTKTQKLAARWNENIRERAEAGISYVKIRQFQRNAFSEIESAIRRQIERSGGKSKYSQPEKLNDLELERWGFMMQIADHLSVVMSRLGVESNPIFYGWGITNPGIPFDRSERFWVDDRNIGNVLFRIDGYLLGHMGYVDGDGEAKMSSEVFELEDLFAIAARANPAQPLVAGIMEMTPALDTSAQEPAGAFLSPVGREEQVAEILAWGTTRGTDGASGTMYDPTPQTLAALGEGGQGLRYDTYLDRLADVEWGELFCLLDGEKMTSAQSLSDQNDVIRTPTPLHHGARAVDLFTTAAHKATYHVFTDLMGLADAVWGQMKTRPPHMEHFKGGCWSVAYLILNDLRALGIHLPMLAGCGGGVLWSVLNDGAEQQEWEDAPVARRVVNHMALWQEMTGTSFESFFEVFTWSQQAVNNDLRSGRMAQLVIDGTAYTMSTETLDQVEEVRFGHMLEHIRLEIVKGQTINRAAASAAAEQAARRAVMDGEGVSQVPAGEMTVKSPDLLIISCAAYALGLMAGAVDVQPYYRWTDREPSFRAPRELVADLEAVAAERVRLNPHLLLTQDCRRAFATSDDSIPFLHRHGLALSLKAHRQIEKLVGSSATYTAEYMTKKLNEAHAHILRALFVLWAEGRFVARASVGLKRALEAQKLEAQNPDHHDADHLVFRSEFADPVAFKSPEVMRQWDELLNKMRRNTCWPAIPPERPQYTDMSNWWDTYLQGADDGE